MTSSRYLVVLAGLILVTAGLFFAKSASGETVPIYGFEFEVDELLNVDAQNVEVRLLGERRIVARAQVGRFIASKYFEQDPPVLEAKALKTFIRNSLRQGDVALAAAALKAFLRLPALDAVKVDGFLGELEPTDKTIELFQYLLLHTQEFSNLQLIGPAAVFFAGFEDPQWLRSNAVKQIYVFKNSLRIFLRGRFFTALASGNVEAQLKILRLAGEFFGGADPDYQHLLVSQQSVTQLFNALQKRDLEALRPVVARVSSDEALDRALAPVLVSTLHAAIQKALESSELKLALDLLGLIQVHWRTPTTHALVLELLGRIPANFPLFPALGEAEHFILAIAQKDDAIRAALIDFLEARAALFVEAANPGLIEGCLQVLIQLRPDPNSRNDSLRFEEAYLFAELGNIEAGRAKFEQIKTPLSLSEHARAIWASLYVDIYMFLASILAGLLLAYMVGARVARLLVLPLLRSLPNDPADPQPWRFRLKRAFKGTNEDARAEYYGLLGQLGLGKKASRVRIKQAYRNLVKEVHPDIVKTDQAQSRFIELNSAYERIMKLRKALGLDR